MKILSLLQIRLILCEELKRNYGNFFSIDALGSDDFCRADDKQCFDQCREELNFQTEFTDICSKVSVIKMFSDVSIIWYIKIFKLNILSQVNHVPIYRMFVSIYQTNRTDPSQIKFKRESMMPKDLSLQRINMFPLLESLYHYLK